MATGDSDRRMSAGDVLSLVKHYHDGTTQTYPVIFLTGGEAHVATAIRTGVAHGDAVIQTHDEHGYTTPYLEKVILDAQTTAGTNKTGTAFSHLHAFKDGDLAFYITGASGTSPTLDMLIDTRFDGTNWTNMGHLTQISATGTVIAHISRRQSAAEIVVTADATAGTLRAIGFGSDLRIRSTIGGTSPSFTWNVVGNFY